MDQGIDFFFANRSHAVKFVEFLGKVAPTKSRHDNSLQLVEYDIFNIEVVSPEYNLGGSKYVIADAEVARSYEEKRQKKRGKPRPWKLKSLEMEVDESRGRGNEQKVESEYEEFLRDLEENPELRFNLSLYRNKEYQPSEMASVLDGDDVPSIPLEELLADLELSEQGDGEDTMRE
ncbi:Detected protein of confused Function [Hibiscus syriacus]|uniref:Detected protein of confused Function n=1 Tax=Hibiscus syriacus TaxID=106335 RepID=A0A6A2YSS5_HIBSY|nr:Detected protein of confused Function [Hibiscus syriacus]